MNTTELTNKEKAILLIVENYQGLTRDNVEQLIKATNGITGCSFVSIKGYSSDKSNNTEVADQKINIGASYKNMLKKDDNIFTNFDLSTVNVDDFHYNTIDTGKLTLEEFKAEVKKQLPIALDELCQPKAKKDTSSDIWLNKALVFNLNTLRLSVFGQQITKNVTVQSTNFQKVKSAPKTVAKKLIEKQAKGKSQTLRRFALDNVLKIINVNTETIEFA